MAEKNYKELYLAEKRRNEELGILNSIIAQITQCSDLSRVLRSAVDMVMKHVGFTSASVLIINEQQDELVLHSHISYPAEYILTTSTFGYKRGMGLMGLAWEHSAPVYCEDLTKDARNLRRDDMAHAGYRTGLFIPLIYRGTTLGVLELLSKSKKKPTSQEMDFLNAACSELAIALDYQSSYRGSMAREMDLAAKIEEIKVMNEIDRLVLHGPESSEGDGMEFLNHLTHIFRRLIPCDKACFYMVDWKRKGFVLSAGRGCSADREELISFEQTNLTQVIEAGMVISRPDLTIEKKLLPFDQKILERGFCSDIRIPLVYKGRLMGVLSLASQRIGGFTPNHLQMAEKLSARASVALSIQEAYSNIRELFISTTKALSSALAEKDTYAKGHSERVSVLATQLGKELRLDGNTLNNLMLAALLHDIGKIGIPDTILNKPGRLDKDEYSVVKEHPLKSVKILESINHLKDILDDVLYHHESFDGNGYPKGLKGKDIPIGARIIKICDTFDAMTSPRPYRDAMPTEDALTEIRRYSGLQFDPDFSNTFLPMQIKDSATVLQD